MENVLWETIQNLKNKKIGAREAIGIVGAAKEICSVARLRLQYRVIESELGAEKYYSTISQPSKKVANASNQATRFL